ncbi:membrane protein of unknown function [Cyanobium sp. NIES-981]|nr:membrane protein of unknown function [Cyanobium sp. NIES-981]
MPTKSLGNSLAIRNPFKPSDLLVLNTQWVCLLWLVAIFLTILLNALPVSPGALQFEFFPLHVLSLWTAIEKQWAAFGLGLDFLYMLVYSLSIAILCLLGSRALSVSRCQSGSSRVSSCFIHFAWLGVALAWGQFAAVVLDTAENISLLSLLFNLVPEHSQTIAHLSVSFAFLKFVIILSGFPLYPIVCLVCLLKSRSTRNT